MTIGLQSTAVSLSDLAAMGARPLGVLLAFGDPDLDERYVMGILEGATACCETAQTRLLGGEDYELLYTIPNERFRMELGTVIDRVVNNGISLRTAEREIPLANRGWEHGT